MLQPLVMGRAVSIHPLAVVLAIAAGAVLAGIVGALLAVPTVAFLNSAVRVLAAREPEAELEAQETEPGKVIEADADDIETAEEQLSELAPAALPAQQVQGADAAAAPRRLSLPRPAVRSASRSLPDPAPVARESPSSAPAA